jgi:hypothetical protein
MTPDADPLIGTAVLTIRWGISRERIYQLVRTGRIPRGQLTAGVRLWTLTDIERYEADPDPDTWWNTRPRRP